VDPGAEHRRRPRGVGLDGWAKLNERLGGRVQLLGDDILVTNPAIVAEAIDRKTASAALIKINQIGTLTETLETCRLCRQAGWAQMVSHGSGETGDAFVADLATAQWPPRFTCSAARPGELPPEQPPPS
jgi:enolase